MEGALLFLLWGCEHKAGLEVGISGGPCMAWETFLSRNFSKKQLSICCELLAQLLTMSWFSAHLDLTSLLLGMKNKVPFAGVFTALGAAQIRGRRLQAGWCFCLAAAAPPTTTVGRWCFCCFVFLLSLDLSCVWAQWKLQGQAQQK